MGDVSLQAEQGEPALRFVGVTKAFGHSTVLEDVTFDVREGEIHALLGVNGAGKSTLIKVLAGLYQPDAGFIEVRGEPIDPSHDATTSGVAFVHQDLGLVDDLSVSDNIALQLGFIKRLGLIDDTATSAQTARALAAVGADFAPDRLVSSLSRDEQVLCALARALAQEPRVVVLDEVSASLPGPEVERLAAALRSMRRGGVAFIYVTHRLDELAGLVDRVTVLRNGRKVLTAPLAGMTHEELVRSILGTEGSTSPSQPVQPDVREGAHGEPALVVRELTTKELPVPLSFEVRAGEVLGICGLVGSGTRELAQALAGARKPTGGTVTLSGSRLPLGRPDVMMRSGCAVVPGDRQREGIITGLGLRENLLPARRAFGAWSRAGFRNGRRETRAVLETSVKFGVVPSDLADRDVAEFSGGNQQKIIFARALADKPALAVLEDPTAGVDVGSRAVLYALMHEAARAGTAVVLISTDFDEVAAQSHRVIVLSHGEITAEFADARDLDADRLAEASYSVPAAR